MAHSKFTKKRETRGLWDLNFMIHWRGCCVSPSIMQRKLSWIAITQLFGDLPDTNWNVGTTIEQIMSEIYQGGCDGRHSHWWDLPRSLGIYKLYLLPSDSISSSQVVIYDRNSCAIQLRQHRTGQPVSASSLLHIAASRGRTCNLFIKDSKPCFHWPGILA